VEAALTAGGLAGLGPWILLDRNLKRVVLGIGVLGNAINLGVLTAGQAEEEPGSGGRREPPS
jgi:multicomponent Na+:H+ antiporter subunit C